MVLEGTFRKSRYQAVRPLPPNKVLLPVVIVHILKLRSLPIPDCRSLCVISGRVRQSL